MNARTIPLLLTVAAVVLAAGTAAAAVTGSPNISVSLQDDTVAAGEETTLEVVLVNSGDIDSGSPNAALNSEVTTARGLTVDASAGRAPISVTTGTRSLGSLATGAPTTVAFDISVDDDAEPGTYRVPVELDYDYYRLVSDGGTRQDSSVSRTRYVTVTVSDDATFDVTNVTSNAQVGSSGTVAVTVENTGQTAATNAEVTLGSQNGELTFGERTSSVRSVDSWAPGETRTFRYDVTAADDAQAEAYPFNLSVAFDNPDGVRKASTGTSLSIAPDPEQTFSLSEVESSLSVGSEGTIEATLTNEGPRAVDNVVLTWQSEQSNLSPQETQVALGSLAPGDSQPVSFSVDATDSAQEGTKQFDFVASFRNSDGDREESDTLEIQAAVEPDTDEFDLEATNTSIGVGQSDTIDITVTNARDVPLTDITAKLFTTSPISADDDEAFVAELGPGESETLTFSVSAGGSALEKAYPISLDFEYNEPDGDTKLSDTYRVAIDVTDESGGGGLPLVAIGAVVVVLVLAVGGYARFR